MREHLEQLAIFTQTPLFTNKLYVGCPNSGERSSFLARVNDIFDRKWFTNNGIYVQEFEAQLAKKLNVKHCIVTCNATIALEITIKALGLSGEVIVPSFTFVATPHSLQWQQVTPVFCDINPTTHNLDPKKIEALITPSTSAIIGVHVWGRPCPIHELTEIAKANKLHLIFDAAHAFYCSYQGTMVGSFGDAEVFSFHATKFFNTFEGGAITTNNDELAKKIRLMKNFGFSGYDTVTFLGTNGKMTEISAAMGLTSLESLDSFITHNKINYHEYKRHLIGLPGISLIQIDDNEQHNYQYIVIEVDPQFAGIDRDTLLQILHAENIIARRYFFPGCHQMQPYASSCTQNKHLPETQALTHKVLSLPTGTAVSSSDIASICSVIKTSILNASTISSRMQQEAAHGSSS